MIKFEKVPFNIFLQSANVVEWIAPDVLESPEFWVSAYQGLDLPTTPLNTLLATISIHHSRSR